MAVDSGQKVGMVFGELLNGEVNVRIWIHPDYRQKGYGTAALRKSRSEMAWCFPRCRWLSGRRRPSPAKPTSRIRI